MIEAHARARGTDDHRIAASMFLQGYARGVAEPVVAALVRGRSTVTDSAAEHATVRLVDGWIERVDSSGPGLTIHNWDRARQRLFDNNLSCAVAAVRATYALGNRTLWGNVASALASAFRSAVDTTHADPTALVATAQRFLDHDRRTRNLCRVDTVDHAGRTWMVHRRATCCLAYNLPDTRHCASCTLLLPHEQRARLVEGFGSSPGPQLPWQGDAGCLDPARTTSGERRETSSVHRA